jgi:hypothetical protein
MARLKLFLRLWALYFGCMILIGLAGYVLLEALKVIDGLFGETGQIAFMLLLAAGGMAIACSDE